jgi:hypothetical protein
MTQFRKKKIANNNALTISSLIGIIQCTPTCHNWDDFFDFSRMTIPKNGRIFYRRITLGSTRFVGNYIQIWAFILLIASIFINRWFLLPLIIVPVTWIIICIATVIGDYNEEKRKKEYIIPLHERVS